MSPKKVSVLLIIFNNLLEIVSVSHKIIIDNKGDIIWITRKFYVQLLSV